MSKKVILSVTNDLTIDNRLHKVCSTLHNAGFDVLLVGRQRPTSLILQQRDYKTHRISMLFDKGKLFYLEYNFKLFWFLLFQKCDILTANDHDVLLPNFLVSKFRSKKLVFDCHEYFTELPELVERPFTRSIWVLLEKSIFPFLKEFSTVNQTIATIYSEKYCKKVVVIPNVPRRNKQIANLSTFDSRILLYQGNVHPARGIELMIEALVFLEDVTLWIVGNGDIFEKIKALAGELNVLHKIKFFGQIPLEELSVLTTQASIGLSLEESFGLNSTYSLPNKFLDYLQAGLPVIVSDLPELTAITEKNEVGIVLKERNAKQLAKEISFLLNDNEKYSTFKANTINIANQLCWENYEKLLLEMYK